MGIVNFGIPIEQAKYIREIMALDVAVEGGTYLGGTAKELRKVFDKVYTIEKSKKMFVQAERNLSNSKNIYLLEGDTRTHLPGILASEDSILFWLDAHWSGGNTYGESDECPLIDELKLIFESKKKCAILIDDARLFMAPPPLPHNEGVWPSVKDISACLPVGWELIIWKDVIYLTPNEINFRKYMQAQTTTEWLNYGKKSKFKLKGRVRNVFNYLLGK